MDEIYQQIRENLDKVKEREKDVARKEKEVEEESSKIQSMTQSLEQAKLQYEKKLEDLEREKLEMSNGYVEGEAIVHLNVQGQIMCTKRNTLTQVCTSLYCGKSEVLQFPESRLAYMFNGRWEDQNFRDNEGRVFLDVQPSLFRRLLDYLTSRNLAVNHESIPTPELSELESIHFRTMLRHFGVETAIYPSTYYTVFDVSDFVAFSDVGRFSQALKSRCIVLSQDASTATNISEGTGYILSEDIYRNQIVKFNLLLETLADAWVFLGVIMCTGDSEIRIEDNSFNNNPRAYGWADNGGLWIAGNRSQTVEPVMPKGVLGQGVEVEILLDCTSPENRLVIGLVGTDYHHESITLPSGHSWRLHINLVSYKDSIRLLNAEQQSSEG